MWVRIRALRCEIRFWMCFFHCCLHKSLLSPAHLYNGTRARWNEMRRTERKRWKKTGKLKKKWSRFFCCPDRVLVANAKREREKKTLPKKKRAKVACVLQMAFPVHRSGIFMWIDRKSSNVIFLKKEKNKEETMEKWEQFQLNGTSVNWFVSGTIAWSRRQHNFSLCCLRPNSRATRNGCQHPV